VLEAIVAERGRPQVIRCDNGPELTSRHFLAWCIEQQIELVHIQPGRPTQNAHVESFHGRLREECLAVSWFHNLFDARRKIMAWRKEYNEERPHSSLGYRPPKEFAAAEAASFDRTERGARNSDAVRCPSRTPVPAETGREQLKFVVFLRERKQGAGHRGDTKYRLLIRLGCKLIHLRLFQPMRIGEHLVLSSPVYLY